MAGPFVNMPKGHPGPAQKLLNSYNKTIKGWEVEASLLPNYNAIHGHLAFERYLGFTDKRLGAYQNYYQFKHAVMARLDDVEQRVKLAEHRLSLRDGKAGMLYGQYVYLMISYRDGNGPLFSGYVADEPPAKQLNYYDFWKDINTL